MKDKVDELEKQSLHAYFEMLETQAPEARALARARWHQLTRQVEDARLERYLTRPRLPSHDAAVVLRRAHKYETRTLAGRMRDSLTVLSIIFLGDQDPLDAQMQADAIAALNDLLDIANDLGVRGATEAPTPELGFVPSDACDDLDPGMARVYDLRGVAAVHDYLAREREDDDEAHEAAYAAGRAMSAAESKYIYGPRDVMRLFVSARTLAEAHSAEADTLARAMRADLEPRKRFVESMTIGTPPTLEDLEWMQAGLGRVCELVDDLNPPPNADRIYDQQPSRHR